jgi:urease accessory protein
VSVAGLVLGDSRFPAGGHAHSGGVEPAVTAGTVAGLDSLELFLRGRLSTAGLVAAATAALACAHALGADADAGFWTELDAEADARTPSPAQREASRRLGRALLRAARVAWPDAAGLLDLAATVTPRRGAHHAVVLGVAAAAAGCGPGEAALIAAYQAVAGPVSAAVRLLALDPMRATGVLARLGPEIDEVAGRGAAFACGPPAELPCLSAPALDLLAEAHFNAEVRLFES